MFFLKNIALIILTIYQAFVRALGMSNTSDPSLTRCSHSILAKKPRQKHSELLRSVTYVAHSISILL